MCRDFVCRWLADDTLPDHWYPARAKIIIDLQHNDDNYIMLFVVDPAYSGRWREEPWFSDIKAFAKAGLKQWTCVVMVKDERIPIL